MKTNKKIILGVVGEIGSGKTTVTEYIKKKYQAQSFKFSDMLRDILNRLYLAETRENMQILSTVLRKNFSEDIMSKVIMQDAQNCQNKFIITEGIRRPSDTVYLKRLKNFYILAIETKASLRYQRLVKRSENPDDQNKTWLEFKKEAQAEAEQEIKKVAQEADFTVDNNGSFDVLYQQIDQVIKKISHTLL